MTKEKVIIIGSSGAIGEAFAQYYMQHDCDVLCLSRGEPPEAISSLQHINFDLENEDSIANAPAHAQSLGSYDKIIIATGVLHAEDSFPEKTFKQLDQKFFQKIFNINTIGPALIAKYFLPLLKRDVISKFVFLSARVGSISDNRLGGWHAYRSSKAALNMLIKNFAIEVHRTNPNARIFGMHPGTVDSKLSKPFQKNVSDKKLFQPTFSVQQMIKVIEEVRESDTGKVLAYDGSIIES